MTKDAERTSTIVEVLRDAFDDLMQADPHAFRSKFRKMAADPFAFYRGSAPLFYNDVTATNDPWADERTSRIWIHGDLHAENFGSYLDSRGRIVFDVNDFDEAYVGHFTWDLRRFAGSLALMGWQKALPEDAVRSLIATYVRGYLAQVSHYVDDDGDDDFALHLENTDGPILDVLRAARRLKRSDFLDTVTHVDNSVRVFRESSSTRRLGRREEARVRKAFAAYLPTIPDSKRIDRDLFYDVRDLVAKTGFGIGSAGLPAYNILVEGFSQALDNDVVLTMKQANIPALSRFTDTEAIEGAFEHEGHRTVVSQRALQAHTDPMLGYTSIDGKGYVVAEVSPYETDLRWDDLDEPDQIAQVVGLLGRATAKVHCASDEDSDQDLVSFQVEHAVAGVLQGRRREFAADIVDFGVDYATTARRDHALFVEAFRAGKMPGVSAT